VARKARFANKLGLTELFIVLWICTEIIWNMLYFNNFSATIIIENLQIIFLILAILALRNAYQKNYFAIILTYYAYVFLSQIFILNNISDKNNFLILDFVVLAWVFCDILLTIFKYKKE
jgi:hypothetical protein